MKKIKNPLVDKFHVNYEKKRLWETTQWLGVPTWKLPFDAWIIQELIVQCKPDFIIETGTNFGGSALFYSSIQKLINHGRVITIDTEKKIDFKNERISFLQGSSTDRLIFNKVASKTKGFNNMVILDSWHTKEHVLNELKMYSSLVSLDNYLIVEDTHVNGNPIEWKWGEGPLEAVNEFLKTNKQFQVDKNCERLGLTFNPSGYLKRIQ